MQFMVHVGMTAEEYGREWKGIDWPTFEVCPMCRAHTKLHGHGTYERNAVDPGVGEVRVFIRRLLCRVCGKTVSLLPSFLHPRFQYVTTFVVELLQGKASGCRKLLSFYWGRFLGNANGVLAFFRDRGVKEQLPQDQKERAMKLLGSIESLDTESFSLCYHRNFHRGFMAKSSYRNMVAA